MAAKIKTKKWQRELRDLGEALMACQQTNCPYCHRSLVGSRISLVHSKDEASGDENARLLHASKTFVVCRHCNAKIG